jgi:hypothetical protein
MLDQFDEESDGEIADIYDDPEEEANRPPDEGNLPTAEAGFRTRAGQIYESYAANYTRRFKWLASSHSGKSLADDLYADAKALELALVRCPHWDADRDAKLAALLELISTAHPREKVLVFSQFADTVHYLAAALRERGVQAIAGVTGQSGDPTGMAWRFSPESNGKRPVTDRAGELRVLIATDVLSEGQNLQDAAIVVNYDLPWAIIRLIQRAGRVDRIGQKSDRILCYSFLPAEGITKIIDLRDRLKQRLKENADVVGTDERFFEDEDNTTIVDLYNENSGVLDRDADTEVDLSSYAYQIWQNAISADPSLQKKVTELPGVVYSTKEHAPSPPAPNGVLVYMRAGDGNDALAWIDENGNSVTESQYAILKAAECEPDTPAIARLDRHHELVETGVRHIVKEDRTVGGALGHGARRRVYDRLRGYAEAARNTLFDSPELHKVIDDIYRYPLQQAAVDSINVNLRNDVSDENLAQLVLQLKHDERLIVVTKDGQSKEPKIICSMGLA